MAKQKILNDDIRARSINLIADDGENLGEMSLGEAKQIASDRGLDLMQMSFNGDKAVVKILDYGKFLYKEKKQKQKNKQRTKTADLKTLKITFKISDHDLEVRKNQAEKFAENGHPLKVGLMLRGRENHYGDLAMAKMKQFVEMISPFYKIEKEIVRTNNNFTAMLKVHK